MKKRFILPLVLISAVGINAQTDQKKNDNKSDKTTNTNISADVKTNNAPLEMAKATLAALGGDKFKNAKTIVVRGSAELTSGNSPQLLPATFSIVYAGEKYRFDLLAAPVLNIQQISDGNQTYTSMRAFSLPPLNRVGLPLLTFIDNKEFVVTALPEKFKKKRGFRITSPEGYYTDFVIDEKTSQVKEYESSYEANGQLVTTSVAIDKYREVEGVLVNEKFSQRLEFGQITGYANFKAKDITVNGEVKDDVFAIPTK